MSIDELIELEVRVRDLVSELEKDIAEAGEHDAPPGQLDGTVGRLSRQDSLMRHQIDQEAQRRRHLRLRLLHEALLRMDSGEYGSCQNCHREIEPGRLEIQPEALLCGTCASSEPSNVGAIHH